MGKFVKILQILIIQAIFILPFWSNASHPSLGPLDGTNSFIGAVCEDQTVKDCDFSVLGPNTIDYLVYLSDVVSSWTELDPGGTLVIDHCLSNTLPPSSGPALCRTATVWQGPGGPFEVSSNITTSLDNFNDYNYTWIHVRVDSVRAISDLYASGRRVSIDNLNAFPNPATVGQDFNVSWNTTNALEPANITLSWSGVAGSGSNSVTADGSQTFNASSPGTASFTLTACGPGNNGYICISHTIDVTVTSPPPPPPPSGRYKCTGVGSGCAFVEGDTGPDQCSPPSDPVCLVPAPTADLKCNL